MTIGNQTYSAFDPTSIIAGDFPCMKQVVTILSGSNASGSPLPYGTVLGRKIAGGAAVATAKAGNTGNGTCTVDATTPVLANAFAGTYVVTFTSATAFTVTDPRGRVLGNGVNGTAFADQIKFVTAAGGTAFVAGDAFNIAVTVTDKYVPCVATATDGSQDPVAILAAYYGTDSSGGDSSAPAFFSGEFAGEKLNLDASWSVTSIANQLRQMGSMIAIRSVGAVA